MAQDGAWKTRIASLRRNTYALYLASRHPQVPMLAKILIGLVVAYALSPIDLIPDFIPVIGYLDDLLLLPLGIWLATRLIPQPVWQACQEMAAQQTEKLARNYRAAAIIITLWILAMAGLVYWLWQLME